MGRGYKPVPPALRKHWPREDSIIETRLAHPGWSSSQIAAAVGCNAALVRKALRKANIKLAKNKRSPYKLQPHERQSVADLYAEGEKSVCIAHEYGITTSTVRKIAKQAGLPPRKTQNIHGYFERVLP